jgi:hypothetical protein
VLAFANNRQLWLDHTHLECKRTVSQGSVQSGDGSAGTYETSWAHQEDIDHATTTGASRPKSSANRDPNTNEWPSVASREHRVVKIANAKAQGCARNG